LLKYCKIQKQYCKNYNKGASDGLKAQKLPAQGNALGNDYGKKVALKGQKQIVINAFALSGRLS